MPCSLFVYFKIDAAEARQLLPALQNMQTALRREGTHCSLLRRQDSQTDNVQTWMEVYQEINDSAAFQRRLQAALQEYGLSARMPQRHVECFVALDSLATG